MSCTSDNIINAIIRQWGDNQCGNELTDVVPALWRLVASEACQSIELQALLTKAEVVLYLMGCEAYSVDTYDRNRQMNGVTTADSRNDIRSQAQSTGNSTRFSKGNGTTNYDETSKARSYGNVDRHATATEIGDGKSFYRDDGKGRGHNNSQSSTDISGLEGSQSHATVNGSSHEEGFRSDCNYEYSTQNTNGKAKGVLPVYLGSFSGGGSEWRKFTRTRAFDGEQSNRVSKSGSIHTVDDLRTSQGTHDWDSFFLADIFWTDTDYEIKQAHDRSDTRRHAEAHAQGSGDGISEEKVEAHNASQGTAKAEQSGNSKRTMRRTDNQTTVGLSNSQRFRNLQNIYDQLLIQIKHVKARLKTGSIPAIRELPCSCGNCCRCLPYVSTNIKTNFNQSNMLRSN